MTAEADTETEGGQRPLNPRLYGLLQARFGKVILANAGQPMVANLVPDPLYPKRQRKEVIVSGEYYRVNCPFCMETRQRLWINHTFGQPNHRGFPDLWQAHCYNGESRCLPDGMARQNLENLVFGLRSPEERSRPMQILHGTVEPDMGPVRPPGEMARLDQLPLQHPAAQYVISRGFDPVYLAQSFNICYCTQADPNYRIAERRIVIPIFMSGELVGWQCRYVGEMDWKEARLPKYYGRPNMPKRRMLYNFDVAKTWPFLVIVEGAPSVWRIGGPATALLGKTMSPPQQTLVQSECAGKPVVLLLDPNTQREIEGITRDLQQRGRVQLIPLTLTGTMDPADYTHEAIVNIIRTGALNQGVMLPEW